MAAGQAARARRRSAAIVLVSAIVGALFTVTQVSAEERGGTGTNAERQATLERGLALHERTGAPRDKRQLPPAGPDGRIRTQEVCFDGFLEDPASDVTTIDVVAFGATLDCDTREWILGAVTDDAWTDDALDVAGFIIDVDGNPDNGCIGGDYQVVIGYDAGLFAGVLRMPSCDDSTWTDEGSVAVGRTADNKYIGVLFDESQIGSPSEFAFYGLIANRFGETESFPDTSLAVVSGYPTTTRTTRSTTSTTRQGATTTTRPTSGSSGDGYWMLQGDGGVVTFGKAAHYGSDINTCWQRRTDCDMAIDLEPTPNGKGYWTVSPFGGIDAFGEAMPMAPAFPDGAAAGIKSTPSGRGAWVFGHEGCVVTRGDAPALGSMCKQQLTSGIIGMTPTPSGKGYWLLGGDGGIFSFGNAAFFGSTGAMRLNQPIVGMAPTPSGKGYWLVAADGGIFSFGDARFFGSTGAMRLNKPIIGILASATGDGYHLVASDGGMFSFGKAKFFGSMGASPPPSGVLDAEVLP